MQMSRKKKHNPQSHKSIEYSQTFTDEDLTVLLKKSEIVQRLEAIEKHLGIAKEESKLEVGKWYKHQCGSIAYLGNEDIFSYGMSIYSSEGNMSDTLHWIDYE